MNDAVIIEINENILVITINRPKAKNSVNMDVAIGIAQAIEQLDDDADLRVGILTGAEGTFCSGMDLKAFVSGELPILENSGFGGLVEKPPKKPLIAAIEGYALAGGLELALACDLIIAADNAMFGIPEVKLGLAAAAGGLMRLPAQIPPRVAMELALTGDLFDSKRALELGLINHIVDPTTALDRAIKLGKKIAKNGPLAVAASKRVITESEGWSRENKFARQWQILEPVFNSEDAIEGSKAFTEKRSPQWKGL